MSTFTVDAGRWDGGTMSSRSISNCNLRVMRCMACGAEMILMNVVQDDTMAVPGFEHHTFTCSECQDVEQRLVFTKQDRESDTEPMPEQAAPRESPRSTETALVEPAQTVPSKRPKRCRWSQSKQRPSSPPAACAARAEQRHLAGLPADGQHDDECGLEEPPRRRRVIIAGQTFRQGTSANSVCRAASRPPP